MMLYLQADNHDFNDAIFEVLDRCEANCSSAIIDSLENLLTKAKDKTNGWKEIDGKNCFIPNIYIVTGIQMYVKRVFDHAHCTLGTGT